MLTANEFGIRLIETFASGVCYSSWGLVALYIMTRRGMVARRKLGFLCICFLMIAAGSFATHHGLYVGHPADIAWGGSQALFAKVSLSILAISNAPEIAQAWLMYHTAKKLAQKDLGHYDIRVRVRKVWNKIHLPVR